MKQACMQLVPWKVQTNVPQDESKEDNAYDDVDANP